MWSIPASGGIFGCSSSTVNTTAAAAAAVESSSRSSVSVVPIERPRYSRNHSATPAKPARSHPTFRPENEQTYLPILISRSAGSYMCIPLHITSYDMILHGVGEGRRRKNVRVNGNTAVFRSIKPSPGKNTKTIPGGSNSSCPLKNTWRFFCAGWFTPPSTSIKIDRSKHHAQYRTTFPGIHEAVQHCLPKTCLYPTNRQTNQ